MYRRLLTILFGIFLCGIVHAQKPVVDSTDYYDDLFAELDNFLDSLLAPRTMLLVNLGATNTFLNYTARSSSDLQARREIIFSPSVGYFHKEGLGLNVSGMVVNDGEKLNPYQLLLSGSYDYLKSEKLLTGISYTRFLTKENLPFYTSPLQNEIGAYFTYRKWWVRPSIAARYGWGTRTAVEEREEYIRPLRLRPLGYTRVETEENISDFSVSASVRHDFYFRGVIGKRSVLRLTPQFSFTSGTQRFGLNQNSSTYGPLRGNSHNVLINSKDNYLDQQFNFQPISAAAFLKSELTLGRFFLQPQLIVNYFFPATDQHLTTGFSINTGFIF